MGWDVLLSCTCYEDIQTLQTAGSRFSADQQFSSFLNPKVLLQELHVFLGKFSVTKHSKSFQRPATTTPPAVSAVAPAAGLAAAPAVVAPVGSAVAGAQSSPMVPANSGVACEKPPVSNLKENGLGFGDLRRCVPHVFFSQRIHSLTRGLWPGLGASPHKQHRDTLMDNSRP